MIVYIRATCVLSVNAPEVLPFRSSRKQKAIYSVTSYPAQSPKTKKNT